jgi:hypothetical protein
MLPCGKKWLTMILFSNACIEEKSSRRDWAQGFQFLEGVMPEIEPDRGKGRNHQIIQSKASIMRATVSDIKYWETTSLREALENLHSNSKLVRRCTHGQERHLISSFNRLRKTSDEALL